MKKNITNLLVCILMLITNQQNKAMMEMAVMMGAQQGASVANETINNMFAQISKTVQKEQSDIQVSMKEFTTNVMSAQSKDAEFLGKVFEQAIKHVGTEESSQSQYTEKMQQYIFKMLSLHRPPFYYLLEGATTFDQAFERATMFTPSGPMWKNVFAKGNWEYDHETDSFWQLLKEPIQKPSANDDSANPIKASYNFIFTEYFPQAASYEIQCEMTLYNFDVPFFAGIMFNKTRWISGNADSLTKCRLVGIGAVEKDNFGVYFTEEYNKSSKSPKKSDNSNTTLLYPLNQIINQTSKPRKTLSKNLFANLHTDPPTFIFRIVTSPETIKLKVWQKGTKEPTDFINMKTQDKSLYMYHGIGFMSPAALTEFKLIKPEALLFSSDAKKQYSQDVEDLVKDKKPHL